MLGSVGNVEDIKAIALLCKAPRFTFIFGLQRFADVNPVLDVGEPQKINSAVFVFFHTLKICKLKVISFTVFTFGT